MEEEPAHVCYTDANERRLAVVRERLSWLARSAIG